MKKHKLLIFFAAALFCALCFFALGSFASHRGYGLSEGRIYIDEHNAFLIDERGSATIISDLSPQKNLFKNYKNGDKVLLLHDGIEESYPAKTGGYLALRIKKGDGTFADAMEALGYELLKGHSHQPAKKEQTVKNPIREGFCGNTQTTIYFSDKRLCSFMYEDSVGLTILLLNLDYKKEKLCKCRSEYKIDTDFEKGYELNLSEGYARSSKGQADLTEEQIEFAKAIIRRAEKNAVENF